LRLYHIKELDQILLFVELYTETICQMQVGGMYTSKALPKLRY